MLLPEGHNKLINQVPRIWSRKFYHLRFHQGPRLWKHWLIKNWSLMPNQPLLSKRLTCSFFPLWREIDACMHNFKILHFFRFWNLLCSIGVTWFCSTLTIKQKPKNFWNSKSRPWFVFCFVFWITVKTFLHFGSRFGLWQSYPIPETA